jgi:hypothetical protein
MDDEDIYPVVVGEPSSALLRALGHGTHQTDADGMWSFNLTVDPVVGAPLVRALMRVEAELLRDDANRISPDAPEPTRTEDQRRADALAVLVERIAEAQHTCRGSVD